MPKLLIRADQAIFEQTVGERISLLIIPCALLFFTFLAKTNFALVSVFGLLLLFYAYATTLITVRIVVDGIAHQIKTYSVWNQLLEATSFNNLEHIDVSRPEWPDSAGYFYALNIVRKSGSPIGLNSTNVGQKIRSEAELLSAFLRSKNTPLEIRLRFKDRYGK